MKISVRAFTLVEILVVIAIITMLVGLLMTGGISAKKKANEFQTETMIASLETALSLYHTDFGAYPDSGIDNLVDLLTDSSAYNGNPSWQGPYLSLKDKDTRGSLPNQSVVDPWGSDYHYTLESSPPPAYKIWSSGPNMTDENGGGDDIKSW